MHSVVLFQNKHLALNFKALYTSYVFILSL